MPSAQICIQYILYIYNIHTYTANITRVHIVYILTVVERYRLVARDWGWRRRFRSPWASVYDIMTRRVPLYPRVIITKGTTTTATTTTTSTSELASAAPFWTLYTCLRMIPWGAVVWLYLTRREQTLYIHAYIYVYIIYVRLYIYIYILYATEREVRV